MTQKPRFSLKKKMFILMISIIVAVSVLAGVFSYKGINDISRNMYISRSKDLSKTAAAMVDPQAVKAIRVLAYGANAIGLTVVIYNFKLFTDCHFNSPSLQFLQL